MIKKEKEIVKGILRHEIMNKRILFWTDDFSKLHWKIKRKAIEKRYEEGDNDFKCDIVANLKFLDKRKKYDAILIDYGLIEDKEPNISFLQECYSKNIKLAYVGAMGGSYSKDAKRLFPKLRFLHDLPMTYQNPH